MLTILQTMSMAVGIAEIAGQAAGVPVAAGLASEIVKSCEDVARYKASTVCVLASVRGLQRSFSSEKRRAKSLGDKSTLLVNSLTEESQGLEGTALQERMDQVISWVLSLAT